MNNDSNTDGYMLISATATGCVKTEQTTPSAYRLARKPNGELILQGAYLWQEGRDYGHEWRDIPTVNIEE